MFCNLCNREIGSKGFGVHLKRIHSLTSKEYYDRFLTKTGDGGCKICSKSCGFISISLGYLPCCSDECLSIHRSRIMSSYRKDWEKDPEYIRSRSERSRSHMLSMNSDPEFQAIRLAGVSRYNRSPEWRGRSVMLGNYKSSKSGCVMYRSTWELRAYQLLDSMDDVVSYQVEPFSIEYEFEGKIRRYFPDLLITYNSGYKCLVEIKPEIFQSDPINVSKFKAAESYASERGISFIIWGSKELNANV